VIGGVDFVESDELVLLAFLLVLLEHVLFSFVHFREGLDANDVLVVS